MASKFLDPGSIFQIEVEEAADKVKKSQNVLKEFKSCFQTYKSQLPSYFTGDKKPKSWDFQVSKRLLSPRLLSSVIITKLNNWISNLFCQQFLNTLRQFSFLHNFSRKYRRNPSYSSSNVFIIIKYPFGNNEKILDSVVK